MGCLSFLCPYRNDPWPPGGGLTATVWLIFYWADGEPIVENTEADVYPNPPQVTIRHFPLAHPDFGPIQAAWSELEDGDEAKEDARGVLTDVVASELVEVEGEWKPVLIWPEDTLPFTTAASFDTWWTDTESSNSTTPRPSTFRRTRQNTYGYFASNGPLCAERPLNDSAFGYGDEGMTVNLAGVPTPVNSTYTVKISGSFEYRRGSRVRIGGTADALVFVEHTLALESGGYLGRGFDRNVPELDDLGLEAGPTYDMHIFAVGSRGTRANPHI